MKFVLILATCFAVTLGLPWVPEPRPDDWWVQRHAQYVQNSLNNNDTINVLFYGDSITEGWGGAGAPVFNEYYAPLGTANYGIGGDRTEHVIWRIEDGEVTEWLNPTVGVLKIGTNNIGADSDTAIATGVVFTVNELRERLPNMKLLLLGVLPRNNEALTQRTSNINEIIKNLDNGNTVRYLDMKDHFYYGGDNFATELYTSDMVHLSEAGYRKWAEVMDPLFREMLNS